MFRIYFPLVFHRTNRSLESVKSIRRNGYSKHQMYRKYQQHQNVVFNFPASLKLSHNKSAFFVLRLRENLHRIMHTSNKLFSSSHHFRIVSIIFTELCQPFWLFYGVVVMHILLKIVLCVFIVYFHSYKIHNSMSASVFSVHQLG